jgi:carboxypeptidase Taq
MTNPPPFDTLREKLAPIHDLRKVSSLLAWDQQTQMPPLGAEARAHHQATLARFGHELFVADEIGALLDELKPWAETLPYDSDEASLVRVTRRDHEKALRVPPSLTQEFSRTTSLAFGVWREAKAESDYEKFRPWLERVVELEHRYIECFPPADEKYDTLLDDYEPEMKTAEVREVFARLKEGLVPLVASLGADPIHIEGHFPAATQRELAHELIRSFGFDEGAWRLDIAAHPFASSLATKDIRMTTWEPEDTTEGLFAVMHEAGHGLYEHGVDPALERTPLASGASYGWHESQSRLWENLVGRSRPFASWFYPRLQQAFPEQLGDVDEETWYRSVTQVTPSLIRVEADEVTYSLHIILRFELEQRILAGDIDLRELPQEWNGAMKEYLGIDVPDDAHGVLQDVHWSGGSFGYFPTYALGNVIGAQVWERLREDVPDVDDRIGRGEFAPIREWLREHVHRHGRKFTPRELLERVVGGTLDPEPYLRYLEGKLALA